MTSRRELVAAVLLGAAGAGLAAGFTGRTWATLDAVRSGIDPMPALQPLTGRDLSGGIAALGLAGLAGIAALLATRGWARTAVGALLTAFGVLIAVLSPAAVRRSHVISVATDKSNLTRLAAHVTVHVHGWWIASLVGGVLLAVAGLLTVVRGRRWPGMSARYDRPGTTSQAGDDPASLWKSLDRGDDPTSEELRER